MNSSYKRKLALVLISIMLTAGACDSPPSGDTPGEILEETAADELVLGSEQSDSDIPQGVTPEPTPVAEEQFTEVNLPKDDARDCQSSTAVAGSEVDIEQMSHNISLDLLRLRLNMYNSFDEGSEIVVYFNLDYLENIDQVGGRYSYIVTILNEAVSLIVREVYTGPIDSNASATYDPQSKTIELSIPLEAGEQLPLSFNTNSNDGTICDSGVNMQLSFGDN